MPLTVRVQNFQSVKDTKLEIKGLTVVTGTNNTGKSAVFRAIRGAFTNTPGDDFVRHGEKNCQVDITFDDGQTLRWTKGKDNDYVINGKEFPKVGAGVPPEVSVFGVQPITAGKKELYPQIASQITGVSFLLHESGSVIAEAVADVKRVNQLSRALSASEKDKRSTRSSLKVRRGDAKTLAEKREGFNGLDAVVEQVEGLEVRRQNAEKMVKAHGNMLKLQRRHREAQEAVDALQGLDEVSETLPASERLEKAQKVSDTLKEAGKLNTRWKNSKAEVDSLKGLEETEESIPTADRIKKAEKFASGLRGAKKLQGRYKAARQEVDALEGVEGVSEALPSDARLDYAQQFRKGVELTVNLANRYQAALKDFQAAEAAQAVLDDLGFDDSGLEKAAKYKKALANAQGYKQRFEQSRKSLDDLEQQIRDQEKELAELNEVVENALGGLEECPTCGGTLDHVHA